ncbi:MAG: alpha/beta fold hydrolase [Chitinophagaceae bacterium]|nr:alpha/beta fold hydrolase [Chitinophagaceae bacterium]
MGKLPCRKEFLPLNIQLLDSVITKTYVLYNIRFTVTNSETLPAFLYVPIQRDRKKKLPAMLALHPTGMCGKKITDGQDTLYKNAIARELAERGYVVIAPDYPGFGDQKDYDFKADRYQSGTMKAIFDNMRCIDLLQSRPDVNPDKIGVIGHSLGGHNAIFTGAFDTRLKVTVSSCGWTLMHDYFNGDTAAAEKYGGKLWPWAQEKYMPLLRDKYQLNPDSIPFDFDEIISTIAPRAFFSNSPMNDANFNIDGVKKAVINIAMVYNLYQVPANLRVCYPDSQHDFPLRQRWQAYDFIDSVFGLTPTVKPGYSFKSNAHYFKRMELFATQKEQKNIVMLGNSLTEGGHWESLLQRNDVANRGIGSDVTEGYINRIKDVFEITPKICFVEGGVNDLARQVPQKIIISNLATLIDTLRSENIIPVLNTVTYVADNYRWLEPDTFNSSIKKLNRAITTLAKKKKVMLIDLNGKITDGTYLLKKYAVEDGIHYTAETYRLWAKEIMKITPN